jgi:hypothetical protein
MNTVVGMHMLLMGLSILRVHVGLFTTALVPAVLHSFSGCDSHAGEPVAGTCLGLLCLPSDGSGFSMAEPFSSCAGHSGAP